MNKALALLCGVATFLLASCESQPRNAASPARTPPPAQSAFPTLGSIERLDPALDRLLAPDAVIEKLAEWFHWSEGPVWMPEGFLLFSDIPTNTVMKWQESRGLSVFLRPSGYTGSEPRGGEPGSNGLTRDARGRLVLCQHGDRRIARLEAGGRFTVLAERYQSRRFNSPNDLVFKSNGDLYFTDPPYGLAKGVNDPKKELPFQGVFRLSRSGEVTLLTADLTRPNGIAFSPDEKILYVANSDGANPVIMAYAVKADGTLEPGRVFFNMAQLPRRGGPDGMKVDRRGNLFATGPGGVLILTPQGRHLGTIVTGQPTANCAWGGDGSVLYITANHWLCRVKTLTRGKL